MHFCQIKQLPPVSPITSVSVKTVVIDAEMEVPETEDGVMSGVEDEEMTLTCRASGGPPVPRISWSVPASLKYEILEEDFDVQVMALLYIYVIQNVL